MSRKPGPDKEKMKKIREILSEHPEGLWVREIARKAKMDKSTVSIYLQKHLKEEIEHLIEHPNQWIKIVRLKSKGIKTKGIKAPKQEEEDFLAYIG